MHVSETVLAFTLLVLMAYTLKKKGILKQEDSGIFHKASHKCGTACHDILSALELSSLG